MGESEIVLDPKRLVDDVSSADGVRGWDRGRPHIWMDCCTVAAVRMMAMPSTPAFLPYRRSSARVCHTLESLA